MMNYFMLKIATMATILFLTGSPWVTVKETVWDYDNYKRMEYSYPANAKGHVYVFDYETEETDENGNTWTVMHFKKKD